MKQLAHKLVPDNISLAVFIGVLNLLIGKSCWEAMPTAPWWMTVAFGSCVLAVSLTLVGIVS